MGTEYRGVLRADPVVLEKSFTSRDVRPWQARECVRITLKLCQDSYDQAAWLAQRNTLGQVLIRNEQLARQSMSLVAQAGGPQLQGAALTRVAHRGAHVATEGFLEARLRPDHRVRLLRKKSRYATRIVRHEVWDGRDWQPQHTTAMNLRSANPSMLFQAWTLLPEAFRGPGE